MNSKAGPDQPIGMFPSLTLKPNNHDQWLDSVILIARAKLPKSVVRFTLSHNECIFFRREYIWMYDPRNPSELDCEEGDVAEVPDDEFIEEWVGANPPDNANIIYRQAYQTWAKKREEFEDGRRVFTANIDLALSQASRTHIRAHHNAEWNTAMLLEDPYRALEIIRQSHAVLTTLHSLKILYCPFALTVPW